jgi:hypothetical protein
MSTRSLLSLLASSVTGAMLVAGCSAAPAAETAASSGEAVNGGTAGAFCDPSDAQISPCAPGLYCEPSSSTTCGSYGSCTASPRACPMIDAPVCGCDGQRYLNGCWATIGAPNEPGTTAAFNLNVPATVNAVVGTWGRTTIVGTRETVETVQLDADMTYSITETSKCLRMPGRLCSDLEIVSTSAGTYTLGVYGPIFQPTTSQNLSNLATELYLQNDCPGGELVLEGIEPAVTGSPVYLARQ